MKKSITLLLAIALIAAPVLARKQKDLDMFKLMNSCEQCDLSGAHLSYGNFSNADLRNADLSGANLIEADLRNADLSGANLRKANLLNADLRNADLSGANLTDTVLTGADLKNIKNPKFCRTETSIGVLNPDCRD